MDEIAEIYAMAEVKVLLPDQSPPIAYFHQNPALASKLATEVEQSNDPALLSAVGATLEYLYMFSEGGDRFVHLEGPEPIQKKGFNLMRRAIDIDPTNP